MSGLHGDEIYIVKRIECGRMPELLRNTTVVPVEDMCSRIERDKQSL